MLITRLRTLVCLSLFVFTLPGFSTDKSKDKKVPPPQWNIAAPIQLTSDGDKWAQKTLKSLSVEQKIGQLIMVRALSEFESEQNPAWTEMTDALHKYHVGSIIITVRVENGVLVKTPPYETVMMTNRLQREAELPLLVAADYERGASMRLQGTAQFPHAMAFGAAGNVDYAEKFGTVVARESRAMGVQWNFFPVADVNSNPANPIINTRSFGEDPKLVGNLLAGYIKGAKAAGMLSTAKHFPGHGDTDTDTHLELSRVNGSIERLNAVELPPFQQAIDNGVDAIMVAHVSVPALEPDANKVATVSHAIITDQLRDKMKFTGLVVTDAMDMNALTGLYHKETDRRGASMRAAVDAFKAGNDMLLMPSDLEGTYTGLLNAVKSGDISMAEIDTRVLKVLRAKASVGLHLAREVDPNAIPALIGRPEDQQLAQDVADAAITLVRDNGQALPSLAEERNRRKNGGTTAPRQTYGNIEATPGEGVLVLILTDDPRSENGRQFDRAVRLRVRDANIMYVDQRTAPLLMENITAAALRARVVVVAAYAVPSAGRRVRAADGTMKGSAGLNQDMGSIVDRVMQIAAPKTVLVAMGNPYIGMDYPMMQTYMCTFSNTPTSENAAARALFGEMDIRGHLPVTLPGMAERGAGIQRGSTEGMSFQSH
jgi:beta-N-acetylhexosaminidase